MPDLAPSGGPYDIVIPVYPPNEHDSYAGPGAYQAETFSATAQMPTAVNLQVLLGANLASFRVLLLGVNAAGAPDLRDVVYTSAPVTVDSPANANTKEFADVTVPLGGVLQPGAEYALAIERLPGPWTAFGMAFGTDDPYKFGQSWTAPSATDNWSADGPQFDLAMALSLAPLPGEIDTVARAGSSLRMDQLDLSTLLSGTITQATSNLIVISFDSANRDELYGQDFQFNAAGQLAGGTLTGVREYRSGHIDYELSHMSVPAAQAFTWLQLGATQQAFATIFGGSDLMIGSDEGDKLYGYAGADTIQGGAGADTLLGNAGDDSLDGGSGNDVLYGGQGADQLTGGEGDDTLSGDLGDNVLFGGAGNDSIVGGSGFNRVNGNQGADTIVGHSSVGDWLSGGQGDDLIDASASIGSNIVNGNMGSDTIVGGAGSDSLRGGQGDDVIHAGVGRNWLSGDLGDNTLYGGPGPDTFRAGAGHDVVNGWHAGDQVEVASGVTWTISQVGRDLHIIFSSGGEMDLLDTFFGSLPTDWIVSA